MDRPIAGLITDLKRSGLLDETLVMWHSEFGRMPLSQRGIGRDHNPGAMTVFMAGAGIQGGQKIGSTDKEGAYVTDRPCRPADVSHTIYSAVGIDPRKQLITPEGRPVAILNEGALIDELYS